MKKITFTLVILMINLSFSQIYYSHYLDQTSEWRVLNRNSSSSPPYQDFRYETVFFDGYEDINGFTYHKMYKTYYSIGYTYDFSAIAYPQSSNLTQFVGYLREDNTGKFYMKYSVGSSEIVYFDNQILINAQIGNHYFQHYDGLTNPSCPIVTISSMTINGLNSKILFSSSDIFSGGSAIEGVGMVFNDCYAPTFVDNNYAGMFARIHCYTKQGQTYSFYGTYSLPNNIAQISCSTFPNADRQSLNSENFNQSQVAIYPNPAINTITLSSNDRINLIVVYDIQGREIQTKSVYGTDVTMDVSNLQAGTYLIQIKTDKGKTTSKLIKY